MLDDVKIDLYLKYNFLLDCVFLCICNWMINKMSLIHIDNFVLIIVKSYHYYLYTQAGIPADIKTKSSGL